MNFLVNVLDNPNVSDSAEFPSDFRQIMDEESCRLALDEISAWPGYQATPLVSLPGMARTAGVGEILYKDEATRFGLGSFKALGGAYAVYRYLSRELREDGFADSVSVADLAVGKFSDQVSTLTVCSATDGNHGRAVAWGAGMFGCQCVIYIHEHVSEARESAIASYGARVVRNPGNYDDAVHRAASDAREHGWQVVSDTSYPGYTRIPGDVMCGYTVMVDEVIAAIPEGRAPTHVLVQGGCGGLAAAVCARLWWQYGAARPRLIVVEPERAACLHASASASGRVLLTGDIDTVMAGLSCGEPSLLAWQILALGAHHFVTITDEAALETMRALAMGVDGDPSVVGGESGVAGLAGLLALPSDSDVAQPMGLDSNARVLVFGSEGDTDPELYTQVVGKTATQVRSLEMTP